MTSFHVIAALTPLISVFAFLVLLRMPAKTGMPIGLTLTVLASFLVWKMPPVQIAAAIIEGLFSAFAILWIVLGAILFLKTLTLCGALDRIRQEFSNISPDRRIQAIIIAWFFGAFIEGSSGFGTPAILCAPLLIAIGFPALAAVVLALVANSTPVSFGAVGTPVLIGVNVGLETSTYPDGITQNYLDLPITNFLHEISIQAIMMELSIGIFVPLLLCVLITRFFGRQKNWREGIAVWPFAIFSGLAFIIPALIMACFLGPEFPSMIGGLIGLVVSIMAIRYGFLQPKKIWDDFDPALQSTLFDNLSKPITLQPIQNMTLWKAWLPYILVTSFLILTRLDTLPFKAVMQNTALSWTSILDTDISARIEWLYLPGSIFVFVVFLSAVFFRIGLRPMGAVTKESLQKILPSVIALCTAVPMVRIFVHSGVNEANLDSMPIALAGLIVDNFGSFWPLAAPWIGSLGTFVSGSATFSNMMLSLMQFSVAVDTGFSPQVILGTQLIGAGAGNMIAVMNVVAVASVAQLSGKEGQIIRYTLLPMVLLCLLAGLSGLFWAQI